MFVQELYVENDTSALYQVARGLMSVQSLYGIFPNVIGKGRYAKTVFDLMTRMRRDIGPELESAVPPQFDSLIIIDRTVDLTTPVVTQLTYEGLIDEFYGIKQSKLQLLLTCQHIVSIHYNSLLNRYRQTSG